MENSLSTLAAGAGDLERAKELAMLNYKPYPALYNELLKTGLSDDNKVNLAIVERIIEEKNEEIKRLQERMQIHKNLFEEIKRQHNEVILEAKKALKKSTGRPRKTLDFKRYNALKEAGATEKQAAEILKMGVSTLRRLKNKTAQNSENK